MRSRLKREQVDTLVREARRGATRLQRRFDLSADQRSDLQQDLLLCLLQRIDCFDQRRGSFGAFAGAIVRRHSLKLAKGLGAASRRAGPSLDAAGRDGLPRAIPAADGLQAFLGQPTDRLGRRLTRFDLARVLSWLSPAQQSLCAELAEMTPTQLVRGGGPSRATLYRQIREIRLALLAAGFDPRT